MNTLRAVAEGTLSLDDAYQSLAPTQSVVLSNATIDIGRAERCRFGEVIYGEGKSADLITQIAKHQLQFGQTVLVTRLDAQAATAISEHFEHSVYDHVARTIRIANTAIGHHSAPWNLDSKCARVVVVTAGSTDEAVAAEAVQTLLWMNVATDLIQDVGVAGPQRLLAVLPRLTPAAAIVVVAGMEAALASVVGGHVRCPIIAVPTSVGYGTNFGGLTALMGMLSSCASNVSVVGIDAGFKGGYVAGLIAAQLNDATEHASNIESH